MASILPGGTLGRSRHCWSTALSSARRRWRRSRRCCAHAAGRPWCRTCARRCQLRPFRAGVRGAADSADVVVGHSGAGPFLPAVGGGTTIYVDAVVPPAQPEVRPSPSLVRLLDTLAITDGWLPPWNEWWPPQVLVDLVPDTGPTRPPRRRGATRATILSTAPVALPPQWWTRPAGYIQLGQAYEETAGAACSAGVGRRADSSAATSTCASRPGAVAEQVVKLVDRLQWSSTPAQEED